MSLKHRWQAYGDVWQRYSQTWRHFWRHRDQLRSGMFRADEAAFLPAALAVQETPISSTGRWIARLLMLMIMIVFGWAIFGHIDIIVNASGKVIPSAYTKTIAAVETGSVVALNVENGQRVKAGQILLQLDTSALDAERDKALGDKNEAVLMLTRNQALLEALKRHRMPVLLPLVEINRTYQTSLDHDNWQSARLHVLSQYEDYVAKWKKLSDDIVHDSEIVPLAEKQAASYVTLVASHDVSRDAWQDKEQARLTAKAQLLEARNQLSSLVTETRKNTLDHIVEARKTAEDASQDALRASSTSRLLTLRSPVDGTVQQLTIHTQGGVVQAAESLMHIVPAKGPMEIEAMIENKDKGFVHQGQSVSVKVDAFEYTKYGTLPGKVIRVSQDAVPDDKHDKLNYSVAVLMDRTTLNVDGVKMTVIPGMSVNLEIRTGRRRVIEYILSPLVRQAHETLHER